MKQILLSGGGAIVARAPRPTLGPGQVLVRVEYSLVSVGTETAALKPLATGVTDSTLEQAGAYASLARTYLKKAIKDPKKAARRLRSIVRREIRRLTPERTVEVLPTETVSGLRWEKAEAKKLESSGERLRLVTDESECNYQVLSSPIPLSGRWPAIELRGELQGGDVTIGILTEAKDRWLAQHRLEAGPIDDRIVFDPQAAEAVTIVITTAGAEQPCEVDLSQLQVQLVPGIEAGLPQNEMGDQGWAVGYSAAGRVVQVAQGVNDLDVGDWVACGGAAYAHHAEYIAVPRNLVCPVPTGVSLRDAATTTVGTIALQGIRRTEPQLGEVICVLGLGLLGQLSVQLLRAAGCRVVGLDLSQDRVDRALALGLEAGTSDPEKLWPLVRDLTQGHGADATVVAAATRSHKVVNQSIQVTRRKGRVILVGDVGLNLERAEFYKKELDLLMSTSYGPGRYDSTYEEGGRDYPYSYVRWTLNRNMSSYLDLIRRGEVEIEPLIDREYDLGEAKEAYRELVKSDNPPLGVLFRVTEEETNAGESDPSVVQLRGHRRAPEGPLHYALVGAGAFGTCMLVPQLAKRKDCFFLRGVVTRDAARGGNFCRENRIEIMTSDLNRVLENPEFGLVVIATRHSEHALQTLASLRAGKHVFVEKPLALTWAELAQIEEFFQQTEDPPVLMVGFNRRFSPALSRLREILETRRSPLVISYRLNGGFIPRDHWIQSEVGGGRNLGEACHMYDVFRSLAGAPVTTIEATSIQPGDTAFLKTDNFSATLGYEDGSVANLIYTSMGPKQGLAKERIEVFVDGESYLVDDFKKLVRQSDQSVLWEASAPEKGHAEELSALGDHLFGKAPAPIPIGQIIETSAVALRIEDLLTGHDSPSE